MDDKIARRIHAKIARKKGIEIAFDDMPPNAQDLLLVKSELAKRALGDDDTATISINSYGVFGTCRETLDYDWFADIWPEVDAAIACLERQFVNQVLVLQKDRVLMVGGSNLRPILEKINERFEISIFPVEQCECWTGAAQLAVTPCSYYSNQSVGIILSDGYFEL